MVRLRLLLAPLIVTALHPLHTTFTEIVQQPGSARVTITVRAFSDDLHTAIHGAGAPSPLPEDSLVSRYVRSHLTLRTAAGAPAPLRWIGQRQTGDLTWMTLEASIPTGLSGARLWNAIHSELFHDQVNIVQARYGGRSESLLFTGSDGEKGLR